MKQSDIINELIKLPESEILVIIEKTLHSIRKKNQNTEVHKHKKVQQQLKAAATALYEDYTTNSELTLFTDLDSENFHE